MSRGALTNVLELGLLVAFVLVMSACGGGGGGNESAEGRTIPEGEDVTLQAGKYVSDEFKPAVSFTLSKATKGWQYPLETSQILSFRAPKGFPAGHSYLDFWVVDEVFKVVSSYEAKAQPAPDDLIAWLQNNPYLDTEKPKPMTVGGEKGMQLDAVASRVPQEYYTNCLQPCLPLFQDPQYPDYTFTMNEGYKARFVVLEDVEGRTVTIVILAPPAKFAELLSETQKVLDTVAWKSE